MTALRLPPPTGDLASWAAESIAASYATFMESFRELTRRARPRFERRDWHAGQQDAVDRLNLRGTFVEETLAGLAAGLGERHADPALWAASKPRFADAVAFTFDATGEEERFSIDASIAAVYALVTARLSVGDIDGLRALHGPLMRYLSRQAFAAA